MDTATIIWWIGGIFLAAVVASAVVLIMTRRLFDRGSKDNTEHILTLAKEVLESKGKEITGDLENKKSAINELIGEIRRDIRKNEERILKSDEQRVGSFSALKKELENYREVTGELKVSTERLKNLLSNNQMRGAFGEQIAENLLKMAGFVIGQDYTKNEKQETEGTRPDFTIFLPDKTKINIDVKFPYASLVRSIESEGANEKKKHFQSFRQDVKNKTKQVSSREYINPEEKTVDFVILFIPNEMIFSYIYDQMNDVWEEALKKKVVFCGPFSFTAILRMVKQAYTNFHYQENLRHIISLIQKFDGEYQKYSLAVNTLGDRISSVSKQYETVATTRDRKLTTVVDKIKNQGVLEEGVSDTKELED